MPSPALGPLPAPPRSIPALIAARQAATPDAPALLAPGRSPLSYDALNTFIAGTGRRLGVLGLGRGDRVALVLQNGPAMAAAFVAAASAATAAPLNPAYRARAFSFYLSDLEARALVVEQGLDTEARQAARALGIAVIELVPRMGAAAGLFDLADVAVGPPRTAGPAAATDEALVLHTSGTTSQPKQVPLTHANLCASAGNIRQALALTAADRCLNVMPLFHIHGLMAATLASLSAGAGVVCTPGFYAPEFFGWMAECRPTWYTAVPTMHQAILARAPAHRAVIAANPLRLVRSSSASLPPRVMAQLEETFGAPVIEAYGMTEASHQMTSNPLPPAARKPGSVGLPAGPRVAIMDAAGRLLAPGAVGEVVIQGDNVTGGYANNAQANAQSFTDGWFRTGDQGYLDGNGYLFLTGRLKEIINRGGEKIAPREIDEVLLDHPAVRQAVAFALPDPELGEDVAAAVVPADGQRTDDEAALERALRRFAAERLAPFKVPRRIVFVDAIPKGPTGKLQRIGLAERLDLPAPPPAPAPEPFTLPRTESEQAVALHWLAVLGLERVSIYDRFLSLGGDSMLATRLVGRLQQHFQVGLTLLDFFDAPTIEAQALVIEERLLSEIEGLDGEDRP